MTEVWGSDIIMNIYEYAQC